jgi:hypothetical protein
MRHRAAATGISAEIRRPAFDTRVIVPHRPGKKIVGRSGHLLRNRLEPPGVPLWVLEENAMRWWLVAVLVVGLYSEAVARDVLARPMERTPSIMVGGETAQRSAAPQHRNAVHRQASRTRAVRVGRSRPYVPLQAGSAAGAEVRAINDSISQQQRELQSQQRQQLEINSLRQDIQRSGPSMRCFPGSLGC